jgi:Ca2+-binding RTX toxin-like protein
MLVKTISVIFIAVLIILPVRAAAGPGAEPLAAKGEIPSKNALAGECSLALSKAAAGIRQCIRQLEKAADKSDSLDGLLSRLSPDPPADQDLLNEMDDLSARLRGKLEAAESEIDAASISLHGILDLQVDNPGMRGSVFIGDVEEMETGAGNALTDIQDAHAAIQSFRSRIQRLMGDPDSISETALDLLQNDLDQSRSWSKAAGDGLEVLEGPWGPWHGIAAASKLYRFMKTFVVFYLCSENWATILGGDQVDDVLYGTEGSDIINGLGGDDIIYGDDPDLPGVGARDIICGGPGRDEIYGHGGDDLISGGSGADDIYGGGGSNTLFGNEGDDYIIDGSEYDLIMAGGGHDTVFAHGGHDVIYGELGDDSLFGGLGNDIIYGGEGSDRLYGQQDHDVIHGGPSNGNLFESGKAFPSIHWPNGQHCGAFDWDFIYGGTGDDQLYGEGGQDYIRGGEGADVIVGGYESGQEIELFPDGRDCLWGEEGADLAYGRSGDDFIDGGPNKDILFGGTGDDFIFGCGGNDTIYGMGGEDMLLGDGSACGCKGSEGLDEIYGGSGPDVLKGGPLVDYCHGEGGSDSSNGSCETEVSIP